MKNKKVKRLLIVLGLLAILVGGVFFYLFFGVRMLNDPNRVCAVDKNGQFKKNAMRITVEISPAKFLTDLASEQLDSTLTKAIQQACEYNPDREGTYFSRFREAVDTNVSLARYYSATLNITLDANNETVCNYLENAWEDCREYTLQTIQRRMDRIGHRASNPNPVLGTEEYYFDILNVNEDEARIVRSLLKTPGYLSMWPLYEEEELTSLIQSIDDFSEGRLTEYLGTGDGHCVAGTASQTNIDVIEKIMEKAAIAKIYDPQAVRFVWSRNNQEWSGKLYVIKADPRTPLYKIPVKDVEVKEEQLNISLYKEETDLLKDFSRINTNHPVALTLDDDVLMTAYFSNEISSGHIFINGFESEEEMRLVKVLIKSGPLPTTVTITEEEGR